MLDFRVEPDPDSPEFDREAEMDAHVTAAAKELAEVCRKHGIIYMMSFCYARDEHVTKASTMMGGGEGWAPMQFKVCKAVLNGKIPVSEDMVIVISSGGGPFRGQGDPGYN